MINKAAIKDTIPLIHKYSSLFGKKDLKGVPIMFFEKRDYDLGKVKKGEKRSFSYHFTNRGDAPLSIANVSACECTTTDYPGGRSIKPGESGEIKVVFDSSEKDYEELIDIEILLDQNLPGSDIPIIEKLYYKFDIEK